jgi:hypothetical protein
VKVVMIAINNQIKVKFKAQKLGASWGIRFRRGIDYNSVKKMF